MFKEIDVPKGPSKYTTWEERLSAVQKNNPQLLKRKPFTPGWEIRSVDSRLLKDDPRLEQDLRELGTLPDPIDPPSLSQRIRSVLRAIRSLPARRLI